MKLIKRENIIPVDMPGRQIWKAVGKDSYSESGKITFGFAHFSEEIGPADVHHHAEEICYALEAKNAWVHFGKEQNQLGDLHPVRPGTIMHIPAMEWHQFVCKPGGFLDIIFIYGQVDDIRPEENRSTRKGNIFGKQK